MALYNLPFHPRRRR